MGRKLADLEYLSNEVRLLTSLCRSGSGDSYLILGAEAAETINPFAFAMQNGLPVEALRRLTTAYPSASSDLEYMLP